MIRVRAGLLVGACVLLVAGCSTPGHTGPAEQGEPAARVPVDIPSGVVATGDILLADGSVFGTATVSWDAGELAVDVPDLAPLFGEEQSLVALADGDVPFDTCGTENAWQVGFGDEATMRGLPMPEAMGDPSFYRYLLVMPYWRDGGGCPEPIVGLARLEWTVPETRPWLDPVDSGRAEAARGGVWQEDGEPRAYRTVDGDTWNAIATRFGITADDLSYLNPMRSGGSEPEMAYADQILNLDPDNRGDSETRRSGSELSRSDLFR